MLSDLQKRKFTRGFQVLDTQKKGYLERADFEALARRLAEVRGVLLSSDEGEMLVARYVFVWEGVKAVADVNKNNQVDNDEWLLYHDKLLSDPDEFTAIVENLADFLFDLFDLNSDGKITLDEHRLFFRAHKIEERLAADIFQRLDRNSDGHLSRQEVMDAVHAFYYSSDPNAPGNLLFGPF